MEKTKNNKKFRKILACLAILLCMGFGTGAMMNGIFAATEHTITATNQVEYVALQHVDCEISAAYENVAGNKVTVLDTKTITYKDGGDVKTCAAESAHGTFTMSDIIESRNTSTGACTVWHDGATAGTKEVVVTFTIKNTSTVATNKLSATLTVAKTAVDTKASDITWVVSSPVVINKGDTGTITVTYTVADYRLSEAIKANYTLRLVATE